MRSDKPIEFVAQNFTDSRLRLGRVSHDNSKRSSKNLINLRKK